MRVVTKEELRKMIKNNEDISNVDTSQITDMNRLFCDSKITELPTNFNTSNVTNMELMFKITIFIWTFKNYF